MKVLDPETPKICSCPEIFDAEIIEYTEENAIYFCTSKFLKLIINKYKNVNY